MQPLISPSKLFKYSITFEETTEDSRETSDYSNSGYIIYNESDIIGNILKKANQVYGIYYPIYFGGWESTYPEQDRDYFEKGVEKYYTLFVENEDGTDISTEEYDFITFLLSNGEYNSEDFQEYAVGGIVAGAVALGVAGLIGYYYFNKRKKGYPTGRAWTKEHYHDNEDEDYEVEPSKRKVPARNRKYDNGGKTEEVYIEFLNKEKGYKKDVKHFNSYEEAVEWARKNFDKFDYDMIKYKYANGGQIIRFDRHASMDSATRNELVEMLSYPFLLEYDVEENGEIKYDRIQSLLEREGVKVYSIKNYLSGLFDGYNYSNTDDFKKEMAKLKIADKEFYDRIIKVYEKISKYPKIDKMMANGGGIEKEKSLRHFILEQVSSGMIANKIPYSDYKTIDAIRFTALQILNRDGDREYSMKSFSDLIQEALLEYEENKYENKFANGGGVGEYFKKFENDFSSTRKGGVKNYSVDIDLENGEQLRGGDLDFKDGNDALFLYERIKKKGEYQNEKIEDIQLIANFKNGDYESVDIPRYANGGGVENAEMPTRERTTITRPTTTPTTTPSKPDKNNPYKPKHKPKPKAKKYDFILIKK